MAEHVSPKVLVWNRWRRETEGDLGSPGLGLGGELGREEQCMGRGERDNARGVDEEHKMSSG